MANYLRFFFYFKWFKKNNKTWVVYLGNDHIEISIFNFHEILHTHIYPFSYFILSWLYSGRGTCYRNILQWCFYNSTEYPFYFLLPQHVHHIKIRKENKVNFDCHIFKSREMWIILLQNWMANYSVYYNNETGHYNTNHIVPRSLERNNHEIRKF